MSFSVTGRLLYRVEYNIKQKMDAKKLKLIAIFSNSHRLVV